MLNHPAQLQEPSETFKWAGSGVAWITTATAVAALGMIGDEAGAAVVTYQLTGSVNRATYHSAMVGQIMFLQWTVESAAVVDLSYVKWAPVIEFSYGVEGTTEKWTGSGGKFWFSTNSLSIDIPASAASYTEKGSFDATHVSFSYRSFIGSLVTDWTAGGLPQGFTLAFIDPVTSQPFYVSNGSSTDPKDILMNKTAGVAFAMVPEPTAAALLGLSGLAALRRRKRNHG